MLDTMRNNLEHLRWVLILVVFFFVATIFFDWGMGGADGSRSNTLAQINGEPITRRQYNDLRRNYSEFYRSLYGAQYDEAAVMPQINQSAFNALAQDIILWQTAEKFALNASDKAVQMEILQQEMFHEDGRFSPKRYRKVLEAMQQSPSAYEESVRRDIESKRMRDVLQSVGQVGEQEIANHNHLQNDEVSVDAILVAAKDFEKDIALSEEELKAYFDAHQTEYKIQETVKTEYIVVDRAAMELKITPTKEEITAYYEKNKQEQFTHGEEVKARHILFKFPENATEQQIQEVQARAQKALDDLRKGQDFVEAAKTLTEEPGGQARGGDLGWFERGRMVAAFEEKAFSMQPGDISDLVKTQFGFHIIKLEEKRPAGAKPLEEVESMILASLKREQSTAKASALAESAKAALDKGQTVDQVAQAFEVEAVKTGFFEIADPIEGIGKNATISQTLFNLQDGNVSEVLAGPKGFYVFKLIEKKAPHQGSFEEVRAKVEEQVKATKSAELAQARAEQIKIELQQNSLGQMAQKYGLELRQAAELRRNGYVPSVGRIPPEAEAWLFSGVAPNSVIGPVKLPEGWAFFRVLERKPALELKPGDEAREQLEKSLLVQKQNLVTQEWIASLWKTAQIEQSPELAETLGGNALPVE